MVKIELKHSNENPFYGMQECLKLLQNAGSMWINVPLLDAAYNECKTKEQKEMFFSLLFSVGDITGRHHNAFNNNKRDSGGNSNREGFSIIIYWMWKYHKEQFCKFLNAGLFNEYSCFDLLFKNRVQTTREGKIVKVHNMLADYEYRAVLAQYLSTIINGDNTFNKHLIAKFLSLPRLSKRSGHNKMLPETKKVMEDKAKLLVELSELMGWDYTISPTMANFKGYRAWRRLYNYNLESVLFSTKLINAMDKDQFLKWFDALPAQARNRVKNRILNSKKKILYTNSLLSKDLEQEVPKYPELQQWYHLWVQYKTTKQAEQRELEEKVRQGQATGKDIAKLEKVKKEAKVTVGATNFNELYTQICRGEVDQLKLESFMNKVNLPYNSLVIIDDSGSMEGAPFNFATFIAAACLVKNPDDGGRNLLGFFNDYSHWYSHLNRSERHPILNASIAMLQPSPFVDPHKSFYENYLRIDAFCKSVFRRGCTNISAIPEGLSRACKTNPAILEALKSYPVWTIISDGEWNNLPSPESSMNDFMRKCKTLLGFKPFIVAIDAVKGNWGWKEQNAARFSGIDNMIYIPANLAQIEQFLTNFKDMETFDVYTPLQSLYRSNRYDLVRANVLIKP